MLLCAFVWGVLGKTLDRSCPMGPSIVIADGTYVRTARVVCLYVYVYVDVDVYVYVYVPSLTLSLRILI